MKRVLFISGVILFSFIAGVAASLFFSISRSTTSPTLPLSAPTSYRCPSRYEVIAGGKYVVISIPNDREFYIGKNSIPLAGIPDRVKQLTGDLPADQKAVFVKGEASVRYETLSSVIEKIHDAGVDRIEIVLDRKKQLQ